MVLKTVVSFTLLRTAGNTETKEERVRGKMFLITQTAKV